MPVRCPRELAKKRRGHGAACYVMGTDKEHVHHQSLAAVSRTVVIIMSGDDIAKARASAHGSCVEQGNHPSGTLLLHIALDDRATIAEGDGHLSAFLDERLGDGWPSDVNR